MLVFLKGLVPSLLHLKPKFHLPQFLKFLQVDTLRQALIIGADLQPSQIAIRSLLHRKEPSPIDILVMPPATTVLLLLPQLFDDILDYLLIELINSNGRVLHISLHSDSTATHFKV